MTDIEQPTEEMMLERMRKDANMLRDVAQIVSMNRDAIGLIVRRNARTPTPITDEAAEKMARIIFDVLSEFAFDMDEAANAVEAGEMQMAAIRMEKTDGTKH